jgi:signal transduction histidine kinase
MSRRLLVALSVVGTAAVALAFVAPFVSWNPAPAPLPVTVSHVAVGMSFIGVGLVAWHRRPHNRTGLLMTACGYSWFIVDLFQIDWAVAFTFAYYAQNFYQAVLAHLFIAFPSGRLRSRLDRAVVTAVYAWFVLSNIPGQMFWDTRDYWCPKCLPNLLMIHRDRHLDELVGRVNNVVGMALALVVLAVVLGHWRAATPARRRMLAPVVWGGAPVALLVIALRVSGTVVPWPDDDLPRSTVGQVALCALPIAFLVGLLRTRLDRSAMSELVIELGTAPPPVRLRRALGRTLHDPSVELAYRLPGRHDLVDVDGRPVQLPGRESARAVTTLLERDGEPTAVLIHEASADDDPELIEAVAAAARLSLENERLQAEVRARLEEVRASRARIVEAGDAERQRVERDLHDGAQQRLVNLSLALGMMRARLGSTADPELEEMLDHAADVLRLALSELRDLARGIRPAILAEAGLGPAIESLAERSPIAVTVAVTLPSRPAAVVEATVYFLVSEALANVAKHAHGSRVAVRVERVGDRLVVDVTDDGVGGADPARGSGLRGLEDRVAALDGRLEIRSIPGRGTQVVARIPWREGSAQGAWMTPPSTGMAAPVT